MKILMIGLMFMSLSCHAGDLQINPVPPDTIITTNDELMTVYQYDQKYVISNEDVTIGILEIGRDNLPASAWQRSAQ